MTPVASPQVRDAMAIFSSPLVSAAPAPAMDLKFSTNFTDARGTYARVVFPSLSSTSSSSSPSSSPPYTNVMLSKKGSYRSGDIHKCDQVNMIVSGQAMLTTVEKKIRRKRTLNPGGVFTIAAGVPHLFYFPVDTIMTEHWVNPDGSLCEFRAWFYKPLRKIVENQTAKAKES